jgi:hypothetical protein
MLEQPLAPGERLLFALGHSIASGARVSWTWPPATSTLKTSLASWLGSVSPGAN